VFRVNGQTVSSGHKNTSAKQHICVAWYCKDSKLVKNANLVRFFLWADLGSSVFDVGVQVPSSAPNFKSCSNRCGGSNWQSRGQRFDPAYLHQKFSGNQKTGQAVEFVHACPPLGYRLKDKKKHLTFCSFA